MTPRTASLGKTVAAGLDMGPVTASAGLLAWDADWQTPAITEQHAFHMLKTLLHDRAAGNGTVYLAFPWATLIDLKMFAGHRSDKIEVMEAGLAELTRKAKSYQRVVTICQHVNMIAFSSLFQAAGVTDIFWSHTATHQDHLPDFPDISLQPFPLYPVQQVTSDTNEVGRDVLYTFIGAKGHAKYLTRARQHIIDELKGDPRGMVVERDGWHYAKDVYQNQIMKRTRAGDTLIDDSASEAFRASMSRSIFTLCPSGTGPNSIRLWEAALAGSVPVILSDTYRHPGENWLWDAATVTCRENQAAIAALPGRLEQLAADADAMAMKRASLQVLMQQYGPNVFVHDILNCFGNTVPYNSQETTFKNILQRSLAQKDQLGALTEECIRKTAEITELRSSTSWRMTSPLRWIVQRLRRI